MAEICILSNCSIFTYVINFNNSDKIHKQLNQYRKLQKFNTLHQFGSSLERCCNYVHKTNITHQYYRQLNNSTNNISDTDDL